jgi:hypothetical protein
VVVDWLPSFVPVTEKLLVPVDEVLTGDPTGTSPVQDVTVPTVSAQV